MRLGVISTSVVFSLFCVGVSHAQAATLYFNGVVNSNWNTLGNWWTDVGFSAPAGSLPGVGDDVIISADVLSNSGPAASVNSMLVSGPAVIGIPVTVAVDASFHDSSSLRNLVIGDACFATTATNGPRFFAGLGQSNRSWSNFAAAPNGDVYGVTTTNNEIYKQTGGTGDFVDLGIFISGAFSIGVAPNGNVYAGSYGGDMYMQTGGVGSFDALNQTFRNWLGITVAPNGDVYATGFNEDIYKQTSGVGDFVALGQTVRSWQTMAAAPNGNIYAIANDNKIYKQTSGMGDFVDIGAPVKSWSGITIAANGDVYASVFNGDIYVQSGGTGDFNALGETSRNWRGMTVVPNGNIYTGVVGGDVYMQDNSGTVTGATTVCSAALPVVTTSATTLGISGSTSLLLGSIDDTGGESISTRGFEYGLTESYGAATSESGVFNSGSYSFFAENLTCGSAYHFRAFATNGVGTAYGADETFTTPACSSDSTLYGIDGSGSNSDDPQLYVLDPLTGLKIETIGPVGFYVTGMAFDPTTGILYGSTGGSGINSKSLITINTETGNGTYLGAIKNAGNTSLNMPDITFRSDGRLYGWYGNDSSLYTIDLTSCDGVDVSCLATKVGDSGLSSNGGNGLAFDSNDTLFQFGNYDDSYYQINPDTGESVAEFSFTNPTGDSHPIAAASFNQSDTLYLSRLYYGSPGDLVIVNTDTYEIFSTGENNDEMAYMDAIAFYIPPDTTAPVITILGDNPTTITVGDTYTDAGATAEDDTDGDITGDIVTTNNVNAAVAGTYTVVYDVSDTALNTASAERTVIVNEEESSGGGSSRRRDVADEPVNSSPTTQTPLEQLLLELIEALKLLIAELMKTR